MIEHTPKRPEWTCRVDGADWPCDPAREALAAEYVNDRVALAMFMWTCVEDFAHDSGSGQLVGAFDRFIAWTRTPD